MAVDAGVVGLGGRLGRPEGRVHGRGSVAEGVGDLVLDRSRGLGQLLAVGYRDLARADGEDAGEHHGRKGHAVGLGLLGIHRKLLFLGSTARLRKDTKKRVTPRFSASAHVVRTENIPPLSLGVNSLPVH